MIARPDPAAAAAAAIDEHEAATDPHTGYQREAENGSANGYAGLNSSGLVPVAQLGSGSPDGGYVLCGDGVWRSLRPGARLVAVDAQAALSDPAVLSSASYSVS